LKRKFLNARSPLRLLEKGLHGGLGAGNVGVVLGGRGVGKKSFLVGVAIDELLRGGRVLHICVDHTLDHVRAHYDTVFEDLAATTHLEDEVVVHAEIDRLRSIRVIPPSQLSASKLRDAVKLEVDAGAKPSLIVFEGVDCETLPSEDVADLKALAEELAAEIWLPGSASEKNVGEVPQAIAGFGKQISVILALDPQPEQGNVKLRALKDHDNTDLENLHVALDPHTLLLVRS
jgi:hypothetical protein